MDKYPVSCPFCGENNFDLVGLKYHLENYCEQYHNIISIEEGKQNIEKELNERLESAKKLLLNYSADSKEANNLKVDIDFTERQIAAFRNNLL